MAKKDIQPRYIIERAMALGANVASTSIPGWEKRPDEWLVELLLNQAPGFCSDVIIVTDLCLGGSPPGVPDIDGAFLVSGKEIREFIVAYRGRLTPHFIDGDVLLVSPDDERIELFHHEGLVVCLAVSNSK